MKIHLIAAIGNQREIGRHNDLIWHLPADMHFFKETTIGHHVIMGRRNYQSIPAKFRPLPGRTNIVLSRNPDFQAPECYICNNLNEAIDLAQENGETDAFIIGGGEIYRLAMDTVRIDSMYLTKVQGDFPEADAFFPPFQEADWECHHILHYEADLSHAYAFDIYRYDRR